MEIPCHGFGQGLITFAPDSQVIPSSKAMLDGFTLLSPSPR